MGFGVWGLGVRIEGSGSSPESGDSHRRFAQRAGRVSPANPGVGSAPHPPASFLRTRVQLTDPDARLQAITGVVTVMGKLSTGACFVKSTVMRKTPWGGGGVGGYG